MKEFVNSLTGTKMMVSDEREAEYLAAGHQRIPPKKEETVALPAAGDRAVAQQEKTADTGSTTSKADGLAVKKSNAPSKRKPAAKK